MNALREYVSPNKKLMRYICELPGERDILRIGTSKDEVLIKGKQNIESQGYQR